jgi:WD40 repeat protein
MAYSFSWHPNDKYLVLCGNESYLELLDVEQEVTTKRFGHNVEAVLWVYWVENGSQVFSTDYYETILWSCEEPDNVKTWTKIFMINEKEKLFPI